MRMVKVVFEPGMSIIRRDTSKVGELGWQTATS